MSSLFRVARNCELSTIKYIEDQINLSWTGITTTKSFTQAYEKSLPVVCVRMTNTVSTRLEVGATTLNNHYGIAIDIFAQSDGQRLDLADFITDVLKSQWTYYEYGHPSGDNSQMTLSANGNCIVTEFVRNEKVDITEFSNDSHDRFRHAIHIIIWRPNLS